MGNLVDTLRAQAKVQASRHWETLHWQAADEITALRARVGELEGVLQAKKDADLDRHIFAWFNDLDCDEMRRCLETYDARQERALEGGEGVIASIAADLAAGRTESQRDG